MYLDRLERYNPKLLFAVNLTHDLAMKQARRADQEIALGNYRGPLHGIPWGAKDLLATRDYPTSWGAEPYKDQIIPTDATVVRRLDEAGAVLVAKLTLGALAQGDRWFHGTLPRDQAVHRLVLDQLLPPVVSGFPLERRRAAVSPPQARVTESLVIGQLSVASAVPAPWPYRGAWTRSGRCVVPQRTVRLFFERSTVQTGMIIRCSMFRLIGIAMQM